ncbi:MAG: hypothetical protein WCB19_02005 [Thermoplasmata archaeon]
MGFVFVVMMPGGLDHGELARTPRGRIPYHGKVMEEQLGMTALTANPSAQRQLAAAPE